MKTYRISGLPIFRDYATDILKFKEDVRYIVSKINSLEIRWSHFKIGKTGNTVEERSVEPDYINDYDGIIELYISSSKQLVSDMEAALIDSFKNDPKCDNGKGGKQSLNDKMADSNKYLVYLVFKENK